MGAAMFATGGSVLPGRLGVETTTDEPAAGAGALGAVAAMGLAVAAVCETVGVVVGWAGMTDAGPVAGEAREFVAGVATPGGVPGVAGATWMMVDPSGGEGVARVFAPAG
jgi:hypothetical protein